MIRDPYNKSNTLLHQADQLTYTAADTYFTREYAAWSIVERDAMKLIQLIKQACSPVHRRAQCRYHCPSSSARSTAWYIVERDVGTIIHRRARGRQYGTSSSAMSVPWSTSSARSTAWSIIEREVDNMVHRRVRCRQHDSSSSAKSGTKVDASGRANMQPGTLSSAMSAAWHIDKRDVGSMAH